VVSPFSQTKSWSMKEPVAPESSNAQVEMCSTVSRDSRLTWRKREVPAASRAEIVGQRGKWHSHLGHGGGGGGDGDGRFAKG
jgi:hypothetical protein